MSHLHPMLQRQLAEFRAESEERRREHEAWVAAPLPRYFHSCRRHVRRMGSISGHFVRRCPCGGIEFDGFWMEKNTARDFHRRERERLQTPPRERD